MNTITSDPGQPGEHLGRRPACSPCLSVHTVMRILAAVGCEKISVTAENSGQAVRAASDHWRAVGVTPDGEEP